MSHPEDKKELAGLARSVQALFGQPREAGNPTSRAAEPTPDSSVPVSDASRSESEVADFDFAFEPDPAFPSGEDAGPPSEPTGESIADPVMDFVTDSHSEDPVMDLVTDQDPAEPSEWGTDIDPILDLDSEEGPHGSEAAEATLAEATLADAGPEAVDDAEFTPESVPDGDVVDLGLLPDDEGEEPVLAPIDVAVSALLAGDPNAAAEVKRLADELVEAKEIDPIARSVARLVHGAGRPPEPALYGVAEALMSPVVLGRLARRIGGERDEARRHAYFDVCTSIGTDMAEALRNELADSQDRLARRIYYEALIAMGDASRPVIEGMIQDDNRFLVRNAVLILGDIGGENATGLVTSALANPDARIRREALRALAKLGDEEAKPFIPGFFDDPDPEVREAAIIAAGELKVERAVRSLVERLDEAHEPDEVIPLLRALGQIGDPGAVTAIERHADRPLFSKPRTEIRVVAYRALASMGTPHARRLLRQALSDKDPEVKAAVREMLRIE